MVALSPLPVRVGGHVGFVVGRDTRSNLMVLGGNQGDAVSVAAFLPSRATGFYWPSKWTGKLIKSTPLSNRFALPVLNANGKLSCNEA